MSRSKTNFASLNYLKSISTHIQPISLKVAKMSYFSVKPSPKLEVFILFISYVQLFFQSIIIYPYFAPFPNDDSTSNFLLNNLSLIGKIVAPGSYNTSTSTLNAVFICLLSYLVFKFSMLSYTFLIFWKIVQAQGILLKAWRIFCVIHDRLFYFGITSLWVSLAMNARQENMTPFGIHPTAITVLSIFGIGIEFYHSMALNLRFHVLLPTKSILQSKSHRERICVQTQKFVMQILLIFLNSNSSINSWIVASLNLFACFLNCFHCYLRIPFYSLKAIFWYSSLVATITALHISFFLRLVLDEIKDEGKTPFAAVIVYWIIFAFILGKVGNNYIRRTMIDLITKKQNVRPEMLIHRIFVLKQIRKLQKPSTDHSHNYEWLHLLYKSFKSNIHNVLSLDPNEIKGLNFEKNEEGNRLILLYLEGLIEKQPKQCLVRLYAAYYYGKKMKQYTSAMKILLELQKSPSKEVVMNALFFLENMQLAVQQGYKKEVNEIDLAKYIQNNMSMNKLKEKILRQAKLQLDIYKENSKTQPDIGKIYENSQKVIIARKEIDKLASKIIKTIPDYYLEPQLLLAYYHSILNFSSLDFLKYQKSYRENYEKYQRKLLEDTLCRNNIYDKETGLVIITNEIRKNATISYCSKIAQEIFGRDLKGAQAFTIMPSMLQNFYFEVFRDPEAEENIEFLGKVYRTFILHRDGNIMEADFYFNVHPFISQGIHYNLLIRPVRSQKEYIIISMEGAIEAFTSKIGSILALDVAKQAHHALEININQISKELGRASDACNTIMNTLVKQKAADTGAAESRASVDNNPSQNSKEFERAHNLWNIISTEGRDLMLRPYKDPAAQKAGSAPKSLWEEPSIYHCKMFVQHYGPKTVKVITFEELINDYDSEHEIKVQRRTTGNNTNGSKSTSKGALDNEYSFPVKGSGGDITLERQESNRRETARSTNILILPSSTDRVIDNQESTRRTYRSPRIVVDTGKNAKSKTLSSGTKRISPKMVVEEDEEEIITEAKEDEEEKKVKIINIQPVRGRKDSKESPKSKSSTQEKVSRAIKEAFQIRFYPRYIHAFKVVFYLLFAAVFITQISLNVSVQDTTNRFDGLKDIVKNIVEKEDLLFDSYMNILLMIEVNYGVLTEDDLGFLGESVPEFLEDISEEMTELVQVTNQILAATKLLSKESRKELFEFNVQYYDTDFTDSPQTYTLLNGFLATQRVVETTLKGMELAKAGDFDSALVYFKQVLRNSLNDVLIETDNSIDFYMDSITTEKENFEKNFRLALSLGLVMLVLKITGSGVLILKQFRTESLILLAFVKLNKSKINQASHNISALRQAIIAEISLEDAKFDESIQINHYAKSEKKAKASQKYETITPKSQAIIRRYLFHFLKLLILILLILAYIVTAFVLPQKTISSLYMQVNQAFYSNSIAINSDIALIASQLTLNANSSEILIVNTAAPLAFEYWSLVMQGFISETLSSVTDKDWDYGPAVDEIFFGNGCSYANGDPYSKAACEVYSTGSQKINIVSLLGAYYSALSDRYTKYVNSDKTQASLDAINVETFQEVTMPHTVLHVLAEYISDMVDQKYNDATDRANSTSGLNLTLIFVTLLITGSLSWYAVLKPVQETDNRMKNVLQMLPSHLVLSNFILKNYLIRTSNGALNFVRNNI